MNAFPDVANHHAPDHKIGLAKVGMSEIEVPIRLNVKGVGPIFTTGRANAYVSLDDEETKGIHMSRLFVEVQEKLENQPFSFKLMREILRNFLASHQDISKESFLDISFELPLKRKALLSDNYGWRSYPLKFMGRANGPELQIDTFFRVAYSSTCPCSAALARQIIQNKFHDDFKGVDQIDTSDVYEWLGKETSICATPHGQRSHADILIRTEEDIAIERITEWVDTIEAALKTPVQTAVKRTDEQEFARLNGQNLMFAEDAARRMANALDTAVEILDFKVKASHFESLHPHDAIAVATKGIKGGF